jgi:hypothetical protein
VTAPKLNRAAWWGLALLAAVTLTRRVLGHRPGGDILVAVAFAYAVLFLIPLGHPTKAFKSEYLQIDDEDERQRHDAKARRYALLLAVLTLPTVSIWLWHTSGSS